MLILLVVTIAGFVAQLVDGSLGMGYGVTSTSLLLAIGLAPAAASASVHLAEIGTSLASGAAHWRFGNIDRRVLLLLAVPGAGGAFLGAVVLGNLSLEVARPWVSVVLLVLGGVILVRFLHGRRNASSPPRLRQDRAWLLAPLGVVGGFVDASGGGGWGPITTSTLLASGRLRARTVIGTVSASEFLVSIAASLGFLFAIGSSGIRWDVTLAMLVGGVAAAPISAWIVRNFEERALGTSVGALILLLNMDRVLGLLNIDASALLAIRAVVVVISGIIIAWLVLRGRSMARRREPLATPD